MGTSFFQKNKNSLLFSTLLTLFALIMVSAAGKMIGAGTLLFIFLHTYLSERLGTRLLRLVRLDGIKARSSAAYLVGFFLTSTLLYILVVWAGISVQRAMVIALVACIVALALFRRDGLNQLGGAHDDELGLLVPLLLVTAAALYKYAAIPVQIVSEGHLNIWSDYFLHGVTLDALGAKFAYGGSFELAGIGIDKFYHYLPFMFPSLVMSLQGMNGLSAATSVLLPQGILLCTLGIYVLSAQLSNVRTGLFVAIVSMVVPAHLVFFQSAWLDPYWGVFIQPGAGYGMALCLLIVSAMKLYADAPDRRTLAAMAALTLLTGITRFHFLLLIAPLLLWGVISGRSRFRPIAWLKCLLTLTAALLVLVSLLLAKGNGTLSYAKSLEYLDFNNSHLLFYGYKLFAGPEKGALTVFMLLMASLLATIGAYAIIYAAIVATKTRKQTLELTDLLPLALLFIYVLVMVFSPVARNGDLSEYKHRHFPLIYIMFAVHCNKSLLSHIERIRTWPSSQMVFRSAAAALMMLALPISWLTEAAKPDFRSMPWAKGAHGNKLEIEKLHLADFIQQNSQEGDVFLVGGTANNSEQSRINSLTTELISLANVPAYLSRSELFKLVPGCPSVVTQKRVAVPPEVANAKDWHGAAQLLQGHRVRWYVYDVNAQPGWAHTGKPAYANNRFAVFDAGHVSGTYQVMKDCAQ